MCTAYKSANGSAMTSMDPIVLGFYMIEEAWTVRCLKVLLTTFRTVVKELGMLGTHIFLTA